MSYRRLKQILAASLAGLFVVLACETRVAAQELSQRPRHTHYTVIDLGTFGGPHSQFNFGSRIINRSGIAVGGASTSTPDPLCLFDFPYCFVFHAGKYENGLFSDLGPLPGGGNSFAIAVNSAGVVVGSSENGLIDPVTGLPEGVATVWKDDQTIDLGTLGGSFSIAVDINDRGQITGAAENTIPDPDNLGGALIGLPSPTQWHASLWRGRRIRDLGTLGTGPDSFAVLVNNRDQVAGFSYTNAIVNPETGIPTIHPFLWENGQMIDVGTLGGLIAGVSGLNNSGQVAGTSDLAGDQTSHPFYWEQGSQPQDIGTFGGDNGSAAWINDAGHVVGEADFSGNNIHHAFLWKNGVMKDLKPIGGTPCSNAFSINSSDQVVGNSTNCHGTGLGATLWEHGSIVDLNSFVTPGSGIFLSECAFINDRGEIAVSGSVANGDVHAFILVPDGECDDDCESRIVASQNNAAPIQNSVTTKSQTDSQANRVNEFRNRLMPRYHIFRHPALSN